MGDSFFEIQWRTLSGGCSSEDFLTIPDNFASEILYPTSVWRFSKTSLSS
jgi:hypothetical protein